MEEQLRLKDLLNKVYTLMKICIDCKKELELEKCIPLCSNCHRDLHYQERQ